MATITPVFKSLSNAIDSRGSPRFLSQANVISITWANFGSADTCASTGSGFANMTEKHVQVIGTPGSLVIQGSNDGVNFAPLHNPDGAAALTITAAGFYRIAESPDILGVAPGGTTAGATVILVGRVPTD